MEHIKGLTSDNGKRWWRKKKPAQIELSDAVKKEKYDIMAARSKSLLVFMVSYGAVGGFLNAYGLEYNRVLCMAGVLGLSLLLSFIYETEKKWFTNLCVIGVFIVYAYVALKQFMILNSGTYAIVNEVYEAAQAYLGITGGGLYNLQVEDSYLTITAIALFVGVVLVILMVIRLQYKVSLLRTILLTAPIYLIPIYFEKAPDAFHMFLLLSGYVTMGILQCAKVKKHVSAQIKQALPVGMALAAGVVLLFAILVPRIRYRAYVPKNPVKAATEESAVTYATYGLAALFMNGGAGGGVSEGQLSQNSMFMPDNETDLIVRFTPYSMNPMYLKAFTGLDYDGKQWTRATDYLGKGAGLLKWEADGRAQLFEQDDRVQSRGIMEVYSMDGRVNLQYRPYYSSPVDGSAIARENWPEGAISGNRYVYYPLVSGAAVPGREEEGISERYLTVPTICKKAVDAACKEAGLSGSPVEIAAQVARFFSEKYRYTLRPGYYFGGMDYISYFLSKNKKGYCSHFASAGTMMLRNMGIPARYVEGYVFTYTDVVTDGKILEDVPYEDYYEGYSPLGETALLELEIPDAQGHAWVEIYLEDQGWVVVEVTPAAIEEEEEETGGFWEAFLGAGNDQNAQDAQNQQQIAQNIENALAGSMGFLGIVAGIVVAIFLARRLLSWHRETLLPERERVRLEYGRLTGFLKERDEDFAKLTTPKEELAWMQEHYGADISEALTQTLYRIFFAPEGPENYEEFRSQLVALRKTIRRTKKH